MIVISNLNKTLNSKKAKRILFQNLNLEIPTNKLTCIVGKSGVGKTTLLHMIANFSKFDSGKIEFFDNNKQLIEEPKLDVVFQNFNLFENLNVFENIQVANGIIGKQFDRALLEKQANFLNIKDSVIQSRASIISGGEKQRVSILRAINRDADFILLDEPTGNLDEKNSQLIFEELKKLSQFKTIVVVTHNKQLAQNFANKIVNIKQNFEIEVEDLEQQNSVDLTYDNNLKLPQKYKTSFWNKITISRKFVKSDFKRKFFQLFLIISTFILTLFATSTFYTINNKITTSLVQSITLYNQDLLIIRKLRNSNFTKEDIDKINTNPDVVHTFLITDILPDAFDIKSNKTNEVVNTLDKSSVLLIDKSNFFEKRIKDSFLIEGQTIKNDNEIIISKEIADQLDLENPIGEEILLSPIFNRFANINNEKINNQIDQIAPKLKIVGLSDPNNTKSHIFIRNVVAKNIESKVLNLLSKEGFLYNKIKFDQRQRPSEDPINEKIETNLNFDAKNNSLLENVDIILGKKPQNPNEIIISSALHEKNPDFFAIPNKYKVFLEPNYLETAFSNQQVSVVGVYKSDELEFKYHPSLIENHLNSATKLGIYLKHDKLELEHSEVFQYNPEGKNPYGEFNISQYPDYSFARGIAESTQIFDKTTYIIFILLNLILTIFLLTYSKTTNNAKRKEFGILKALAASRLQTIVYNLLNIIVISLISLMLTALILLPSIKPMFNIFSPIEINIDYKVVVSALFLSWFISTTITLFFHSIITYFIYKKATSHLLK
ncbi:ATP-binding cassette domain-containing protein [Mesomycoplasma conjunctivae]|uniref:ABC transporter ATP-binding protein n=1 Tax=Mesomycoplasma conjunctivae TaxID=45361 RepID=UPI003DA6C985